jgi:undecaprenyl-diphosphatase
MAHSLAQNRSAVYRSAGRRRGRRPAAIVAAPPLVGHIADGRNVPREALWRSVGVLTREEHMTLWFAALLGLIQGLTEFLPISSSAHLRIAPALLHQPDPGAAFTAVIQLGTLAAVIAYFARDLFVDLPRALLFDRSSPEARLALYLVVGTVPIVVAGLTLKPYIVGDFRLLWVVGGMLIGVGILMELIDRRARPDGKTIGDLRLMDAVLIGCAQACALIPGVSRSGATIVGALLLGADKRSATEFSFFLAMPTMAGAFAWDLFKNRDVLSAADLPIIAAGFAAAFVAALVVVRHLLDYVSRHGFRLFAWWRLAVGGAGLAALTVWG